MLQRYLNSDLSPRMPLLNLAQKAAKFNAEKKRDAKEMSIPSSICRKYKMFSAKQPEYQRRHNSKQLRIMR